MRATQVNTEALVCYLDVVDGRTPLGIAGIWRTLDDPRLAEHAPGLQATLWRLLLQACATANDARSGLAAAERALKMGGAVRVWEAEVRRLRAVFGAALGAPTQEIEADLQRALKLARHQGAKSLELRVATSLLRLRRERGAGPAANQARDLLAAIVAGLPEGRDTHDGREAAALLGDP